MYRYALQPYTGRNSRYTCPNCNHRHTFARYIDTTTGRQLRDNVGRCSREINCGYHYKPRQFFKDICSPLANTYTYTPRPPRETSYIANTVYEQSFAGYHENNLVQFLVARFGRDVAASLADKYHIGTSRHWHGATVFWQVDAEHRVRTGKIMLYDAATGKRVKEPYNHINWAHSVLNLPDYELRQCLFGEHLLSEACHGEPRRTVAIVESEKTAIIASIYLPQFTWLACGSLTNLTADKCEVLRNHQVTLFPDLNCYHKWRQKAHQLAHITTFNVSHLLEMRASDEDKARGLDLADYLLRYTIDEFWAQ